VGAFTDSNEHITSFPFTAHPFFVFDGFGNGRRTIGLDARPVQNGQNRPAAGSHERLAFQRHSQIHRIPRLEAGVGQIHADAEFSYMVLHKIRWTPVFGQRFDIERHFGTGAGFGFAGVQKPERVR
jgi:hypothetical protein